MGRRLVATSLFCAALVAGLVPMGGAAGAAWQDAGLPLDGAAGAESLALDGNAPRLATVTPRETVGFASCQDRCLDPERWDVLQADLGSGVTSVSLALAGGRPTVAFAEAGGRVASATCHGDCAKPASWAVTEVDAASAGTTVSLASAADGTLHLAYTKNGQLRYGRCCAGGAWTTVELAAAGASRPSVVVAGGLPRIAHVAAVEGGERLRYLACAADPCGGADWSGAGLGAATAAVGRPALAVTGEIARIAVDASDGAAPRALHWFECQKTCTDPKSWSAGAAITDGAQAGSPSLVVFGGGERARIAYVRCRGCGVGTLEARDVVVGTCTSACGDRASWAFADALTNAGASGVTLRSGPGGLRLGYGTVAPDGRAHFACDRGCSAGSSAPTTTTTALAAGGEDDDKRDPEVLNVGQTNDGGRRVRAPSFNDGQDSDQRRRPRVALGSDGGLDDDAEASTRGGPVPVGGGSSSEDGVPPLVGTLAALMLSGVAWLVPKAARAQAAGSVPLVARVVEG